MVLVDRPQSGYGTRYRHRPVADQRKLGHDLAGLKKHVAGGLRGGHFPKIVDLGLSAMGEMHQHKTAPTDSG